MHEKKGLKDYRTCKAARFDKDVGRGWTSELVVLQVPVHAHHDIRSRFFHKLQARENNDGEKV